MTQVRRRRSQGVAVSLHRVGLVFLYALIAACGGSGSNGSSTAQNLETSAGKAATSAALVTANTVSTAAVRGFVSRIGASIKATVSGSAQLTWTPPTVNTNGTPVTSLSGYHLYYGLNSGTTAQEFSNSVSIGSAATTSYEVSGLSAGTWYFAVAADATDGTESSLSAVGSKTIQGSASTDNVDGIRQNGTPVVGQGLDGSGDAYSSSLLGSSISWSGQTFPIAAPDVPDAITDTTIPLASGNYNTLYWLGTGVNGNQINQTFVVTYTDGTTQEFTQSMSDWHSPQRYVGESIASTQPYRLLASGATDNHTFYLYGYSFALDSSKTVQSLALPANRDVVLLSYELSNSLTAVSSATSVPLAPSDHVYAIATLGSPVPWGGIDGWGNALAASLLGTSLTVGGDTFAIGAADARDAITNVSIDLPEGNFSAVKLLGTAVNGNQLAKTFVVTYTDGTTTSFTKNLSDWYTPQNYPGETLAATEAFRVLPDGSSDHRDFHLYAYSLPVDRTKTVKTLTLPATRNVVLLSVNLTP